MVPIGDSDELPLSIAISSESSPVKLVDKPMLNWKSKLVVSLVVSPSIEPRTVSTLNDAVVVSEKLPSKLPLSTKPSPPASQGLRLSSSFTKALARSRCSKSEYFEISVKFASPANAENGASRPIVAGATNKLLKSFIKFLTQLRYFKGNLFA